MVTTKEALPGVINTLIDRQGEYAVHRQLLEDQRQKIKEAAAVKRQELADQMKKLKEMLSSLEERLGSGIGSIEDARVHSIDSELKWLASKEKAAEEGLTTATLLSGADNPLSFFQAYNNADETLREGQVPVQKTQRPTTFPQLPTRHLLRAFDTLQYQEQPGMDYAPYPFSAPYGEEEQEDDD